jgi:hypothetical protein
MLPRKLAHIDPAQQNRSGAENTPAERNGENTRYQDNEDLDACERALFEIAATNERDFDGESGAVTSALTQAKRSTSVAREEPIVCEEVAANEKENNTANGKEDISPNNDAAESSKTQRPILESIDISSS